MFGIAGIVTNIKKSFEDIKRLHKELISPLLKDGLTIKQMCMSESCMISVVEPELDSVRSTFFEQFDDGISILIFGEIFNDRRAEESVAQYVHQLFVKDGILSFAKLNGSFCLFIYNEPESEGFLVADKFSSKPVLYYIGREYTIFSPDQRSFVNSGFVSRKVNLSAVAAMLSSGHLYNDDTYIQDVKYLQGGSALQIKSSKHQVIKYWDFIIEPQPDEGIEAYQSRLSPLLLQSVERCVKGQSKPVLFLSGGIDSRALLGACMELGLKVELCSYYSRHDRESDAYIAEQVAKLSGMPFRLIRYDPPDILDCVRQTTPFFGGMRSSIYEYEALKKIQGNFSHILMTEHSFGSPDCALTSEEDMFGNIHIYFLSSKLWEKLLTSEHYENIKTQSEASLSRLSNQISLVDLNDREDYFRVTERLGRNLIPGRCFLNYCIGKVRQPWLDNDILEFMRLLPNQYRRSKQLIEYTAKKMFPLLFSIPKATNSGNYIDTSMYYPLLLNKNPHIIEEACFHKEYSIDSIFERAFLERYFRFSAISFTNRIKDSIKNSHSVSLRRISKSVYNLMKQNSATFSRTIGRSNNLSQRQILERIAIIRFITGSRLALEPE